MDWWQFVTRKVARFSFCLSRQAFCRSLRPTWPWLDGLRLVSGHGTSGEPHSWKVMDDVWCLMFPKKWMMETMGIDDLWGMAGEWLGNGPCIFGDLWWLNVVEWLGHCYGMWSMIDARKRTGRKVRCSGLLKGALVFVSSLRGPDFGTRPGARVRWINVTWQTQ